MAKAAPILGALGTAIPAIGGLFGGGGQGPTTTQQNTLTPNQQALSDQLTRGGQDFANRDFRQFQGPRTQQFGAGFDQAAQNLGQVDPRIMQLLQGGAGGLGIGQGFQQDFLSGQGPGGPQFNAENIAQFTNPFQQQQIDTARAGFARAGETGLNTIGDQFTREGAFGGTRQGIAEGEFAGNLARQEAETIGGIQQRGFDDAAQRLAGEQGRFDQFRGQQLGAAGGLANLGFGSTQALQNALQQAGASGLGVGQLRQQLGQFDIGQQRQMFGEQDQFSQQNLGLLQSILGSLSPGGQTVSQQPGGQDPFQAAGGISSILGSLLGGGGGGIQAPPLINPANVSAATNPNNFNQAGLPPAPTFGQFPVRRS